MGNGFSVVAGVRVVVNENFTAVGLHGNLILVTVLRIYKTKPFYLQDQYFTGLYFLNGRKQKIVACDKSELQKEN